MMNTLIRIAVLFCIIQGSLAASTTRENTTVESQHQEIVDPDGKKFDAYVEKNEAEEKEIAIVTSKDNDTVVERIYMDKHTGVKITESLERNECYIQKMEQDNSTEEENGTSSSCFSTQAMGDADITDQIKEVCHGKSMFKIEATDCDQQGQMSRYSWWIPRCYWIHFPIRICRYNYWRYCCRYSWGCRRYCSRWVYSCWYIYKSVRVCY